MKHLILSSGIRPDEALPKETIEEWERFRKKFREDLKEVMEGIFAFEGYSKTVNHEVG